MTTPADERLYVELDADARALIVDALRVDSRRRQRAATKAAAELHAEKAGGRRDIRSGAVMVTAMLLDASRLDEAADAIEKAASATPVADALRQAGLTVRSEPTVAAHAGPSAAGGNVPAVEEGAEPRTPAEALAESAAVIDALGMKITRDDLARAGDDDPGDDFGSPEDAPDPFDAAELGAVLTSQEATA